MNRTKIICTTGPAVATVAKIEALVGAGMSLMRINCSHGTPVDRLCHLNNIRVAERRLKKPIAVMLDLQGPKLRVGDLPEPLKLREGELWHLIPNGRADVARKLIPVGIRDLATAVTLGGDIFMDDGLIRLRVVKKDGGSVGVRVIHGGQLEARKGVNIPYYQGRLSAMTAKDRKDLAWGLRHGVDMIALSFVRDPRDIRTLKRLIARGRGKITPLVIAKIEKPEALTQLEEITRVSDGILIARGDLGVELKPEKVPVVQKQIIELCRTLKKPVIVATQMLDSMRYNPVPTRAEASDVASAIFAGTDAVLLTGETSSGKYPVAACAMLNRIIGEVEDHLVQKTFRKFPRDFGMTEAREAVIFNAMQMADDIAARVIVMLTSKGELTKIMSKLHPKQPIFSLAANLAAQRQLNLYWGVFPLAIAEKSADARIAAGLRILRTRHSLNPGDKVIFIYRDYLTEDLNLKVVGIY